MIPFSRADRIGGLIQKMLSDILKKEIKDPRLKMITITGVTVTRDLKLARIYFAAPNSKQKREAATIGFTSARGYIKRMLAHALDLKYMPDIKFYYDESLDYGAHIDELIELTKHKNGSDHSKN
jgi:ribosome-binding factor A